MPKILEFCLRVVLGRGVAPFGGSRPRTVGGGFPWWGSIVDLSALHEQIEKFEGLIHAALEEKYNGAIPRWPAEVPVEMNPLLRWSIKEFVSSYSAGRCYPEGRLEQAVYDLFDINVQTYLLLEVDLGLYNRLIYDCIDGGAETPHRCLIRASLDQW